MTFLEVDRTWICQLGKPENQVMLKAYCERKDKSIEEFFRYYFDIIDMIKDTPAWGVSGVNKMVNELTDTVRATMTRAKRGKSSAPAHAAKMLRYIAYYGHETATPRNWGRCTLAPLITPEEVSQFIKTV